jgi:hypothetical protein
MLLDIWYIQALICLHWNICPAVNFRDTIWAEVEQKIIAYKTTGFEPLIGFNKALWPKFGDCFVQLWDLLHMTWRIKHRWMQISDPIVVENDQQMPASAVVKFQFLNSCKWEEKERKCNLTTESGFK